MQLSQYVEDTQDLLRDDNGLMTSVAKIQKYVNRARYQICLRTGCLNLLIPGQAPFGNNVNPGQFIPGGGQPGSAQYTTLQTIAGVEKYGYGFFNPYVQAAYAGVKGIVDVISVSVSWGGLRPSMNYMPFEDLQAYARSYNIGVFSYPMLWSTLGDGENGSVWLFPVPDINSSPMSPGSQGEMELLVTCVPNALYSDSDVDAVPQPFQNAVKYYAASLAFLGLQRPQMAQIMLGMMDEHLGIDRVASDRGKVTNYYPDWPW